MFIGQRLKPKNPFFLRVNSVNMFFFKPRAIFCMHTQQALNVDIGGPIKLVVCYQFLSNRCFLSFEIVANSTLSFALSHFVPTTVDVARRNRHKVLGYSMHRNGARASEPWLCHCPAPIPAAHLQCLQCGATKSSANHFSCRAATGMAIHSLASVDMIGQMDGISKLVI